MCTIMRRVLKRLETPLLYETGFNAADNPYTESEFLKLCKDYRVPTGMKNFIGLISVAFIGSMIILTLTQWLGG